MLCGCSRERPGGRLRVYATAQNNIAAKPKHADAVVIFTNEVSHPMRSTRGSDSPCFCAGNTRKQGERGRDYNAGWGVTSVLAGKRGYTILGCLPVRLSRNATMAPLSPSLSRMPNWADPMTSTASFRLQTTPEWK